MSAKAFVDTNIFVYAALQAPGSQRKREAAIAVLASPGKVVVSTQVLNEFAAVLLKNRFFDADIQARVEAIAADSSLAVITIKTIRLAWQVKDRYQLSYWDSLIVASALQSGCTILYTEDLSHGMVIDNSLRITNPLV